MRSSWVVAAGVVLVLAAGAKADGAKPASPAGAQRPEPPLARKLARLQSEYEANQRAFDALFRGSTIPEENRAKAAEIQPDLPKVVREISDLAATSPTDPAFRDAMLWVVGQTQGGLAEPRHAGCFAQAATWLLRYFGDDPDAVRVGLDLDNSPTTHRDHLLLNFYVSAKGREAKGLARLALAQYLETKAQFAERARKTEGRPTIVHEDAVRADGTLYTATEVMPDEQYAYLLSLRQSDVSFLRAEAERLYEEVIAEYGDVPHITVRRRFNEALLKQPNPQWNGAPLTDDVRRTIEVRLARRSTLGEVAETRLDDWHKLAVGNVAPEIKGVDVRGKPLSLSAYRGKVVALVFWGTWCAPCMRQVPHEKALVERMKGRPFAMLGVDTDADAATARRVMDAQGITWPSWHDGDPGTGPITRLYHIRGFPTTFVIDGKGKIRSKESLGTDLDQLVETLVVEQEAASR